MAAEAAALIGACAPVPPRTPRANQVRGQLRAVPEERSNTDDGEGLTVPVLSEMSDFEQEDSADDDDQVQEIRVNSLAGRLCTLTLEAGERVSSLKSAIEAKCGTPVASQRLIAGTCELYDLDIVPRNVVGGGPIEVVLLRRTKQEAEWLMTVTNSWTRFLGAPREIRADYEVALAAVTQKGSLLNYASQELRADLRVVLAAVQNDGNALQFASEALRGDPEVVMRAVMADGRALGYAAPALRSDREIASAAVRCQPSALQYADEELRNDRELVLLAVHIDGNALRYAGRAARKDVEVVVAAIKRKPKAFRYSVKEIRLHPDVLAALELEPDSD